MIRTFQKLCVRTSRKENFSRRLKSGEVLVKLGHYSFTEVWSAFLSQSIWLNANWYRTSSTGAASSSSSVSRSGSFSRIFFVVPFAPLSCELVAMFFIRAGREHLEHHRSVTTTARWWFRYRCFLGREGDRAGKILRRKSEGILRRTESTIVRDSRPRHELLRERSKRERRFSEIIT